MPLRLAIILLPPVILNVRSSPSTSLADKLVLPDPSSSKDTSETLARTGASLTAFTVNVNVSESSKYPSVTVIVNVSLPLKSCAGEKLNHYLLM